MGFSTPRRSSSDVSSTDSMVGKNTIVPVPGGHFGTAWCGHVAVSGQDLRASRMRERCHAILGSSPAPAETVDAHSHPGVREEADADAVTGFLSERRYAATSAAALQSPWDAAPSRSGGLFGSDGVRPALYPRWRPALRRGVPRRRRHDDREMSGQLDPSALAHDLVGDPSPGVCTLDDRHGANPGALSVPRQGRGTERVNSVGRRTRSGVWSGRQSLPSAPRGRRAKPHSGFATTGWGDRWGAFIGVMRCGRARRAGYAAELRSRASDGYLTTVAGG